MNRNTLEAYAQKARRDFIAAVTARAESYGLNAKRVEPIVEEGDVVRVGAHAFPRTVVEPRKRLEEQIRRDGFAQVMEAMAYTWFNRLAAIRYMELHGYLGHGYRVLSHPEGQPYPEILEHAADVDLPGLHREKAVELKLDGSQDEELYRLLLKAQCNALHQAMPFLFEHIGDETELLLPANLLHTDSLIRQMVEGIDESAWEPIEIIGWLYQFYISEKKSQVIGKVVASEDIPAATQLFTPNWIVKYLVQNSLGVQWLATYPHSQLRGQMDYYIEPAEQTDEVTAQLAAITPGALNPEMLTLIDPACGSGHILVEAYDLFKAIYMERGYQKRDVVRLILEKNLFGLDIDGRAAQLTGFALMMKARADDRRLFERGVVLNVMALVDSKGFDAERLAQCVKLANYGLAVSDLTEMKRLFEHATTFGSLIRVPEGVAAKLPSLRQLSEVTGRDLFVSDALKRLGLLMRQAGILAAQYDAVVANPPYMGSGGMNAWLKEFAKDHFPEAKSDLFACFIERGGTLTKDAGHNAMVTMQSWMFLSSFKRMRERMLREKTIGTMAHLGARAFASISGEVVQTTAFTLKNHSLQGYNPVFFRLVDGNEAEKKTGLLARRNCFALLTNRDFLRIPDAPLGYWLSKTSLSAWEDSKTTLADAATFRAGLQTGDNETFLRFWHEVPFDSFVAGCTSREAAADSLGTWFPHNKGGGYRKWYGICEYAINWANDGSDIKAKKEKDLAAGKITPNNSKCWNQEFYFKPGFTWSSLSSMIALRSNGPGFLFDTKGQMLFPDSSVRGQELLAYMNSTVSSHFLEVLAPTLDFNGGTIAKLPFLGGIESCIPATAILMRLSRKDWDAFEPSWDFESLPILTGSSQHTPTLESSYTSWITQNRETIAEMKRLEEGNNDLFIDAYGLQDEITPDIPIEEITLTVNPAYRYGGKLTEEEQWTRFRQDTMKELVSYAIGCMMRRYSLDAPGLIYAHSGNANFDATRYTTFPADSDGIIPLTDFEWFDDDACHRLIEFISVAWDTARLEANLAFLADNLSPRNHESSRKTLRRYLCESFFRDHLQTYRKRPIYWLFSSGKQKTFPVPRLSAPATTKAP